MQSMFPIRKEKSLAIHIPGFHPNRLSLKEFLLLKNAKMASYVEKAAR